MKKLIYLFLIIAVAVIIFVLSSTAKAWEGYYYNPSPTPTATPIDEEDCLYPGQQDLDHSSDDVPCIEVTPTPTPSETPAPSETPVPSETPIPTPEESATPRDLVVTSVSLPSRDDSPRGPFNAPTCGDSSVTQNVVNPLVWRKGDQAKVQWWPTSGSQVNIYYKQVSSPVWQYSLINQPNNGYAVINGLGTMGITFAIEQINGCAGGPVNLVKIVDGYSDGWVLFRP